MSEPKNPMTAILDSVDWTPVEPPGESNFAGLPTVTHQGVLTISGVAMRVYQLSDGKRVIAREDMERFFGGMASTGPDAAGGGA
jgi:hypothetical protein